MPYVVADEVFLTKDALKERARAALSRTKDGMPTEEADTEFLLALFQHHDEWDEKSAGGVCEIITQMAEHGTRCFVIRRQDGSKIDISFLHAIRLLPSTRGVDILPQGLRDFRSAARIGIQSQIHRFRDKALLESPRCPLTGDVLLRSNAAVDHVAPLTFDELAFRFCRENGVNPLDVRVGSQDGVVAVFEDIDLLKRWQFFHNEKARLRLVSRLGNLKLSKTKVSWSELWTSGTRE